MVYLTGTERKYSYYQLIIIFCGNNRQTQQLSYKLFLNIELVNVRTEIKGDL
jgi:hypothetical protein